MYKKEVTSAWNPSNRKFLREKRKSSLKFKAKIEILVEKNEIITIANLFSFTSKSYWHISEGEKLYSENCVIKGKRERERERERSMEDERPKLMTVKVWGEKK